MFLKMSRNNNTKFKITANQEQDMLHRTIQGFQIY